MTGICHCNDVQVAARPCRAAAWGRGRPPARGPARPPRAPRRRRSNLHPLRRPPNPVRIATRDHVDNATRHTEYRPRPRGRRWHPYSLPSAWRITVTRGRVEIASRVGTRRPARVRGADADYARRLPGGPRREAGGGRPRQGGRQAPRRGGRWDCVAALAEALDVGVEHSGAGGSTRVCLTRYRCACNGSCSRKSVC